MILYKIEDARQNFDSLQFAINVYFQLPEYEKQLAEEVDQVPIHQNFLKKKMASVVSNEDYAIFFLISESTNFLNVEDILIVLHNDDF